MKIVRRFVKDELGATLALSMMMIVLLGIMGAGLLTFVSRDMNSVIEENRGQRALELADAGVAAAKSQLTTSCAGNANCGSLYNGNADGITDIRWSKFYAGVAACQDPDPGGMTLTGLDGSATTPNDVRVTIEYRPDTRDFRVISTGCYGVAKRRIEAILKGVVAFGGGAGGLPTLLHAKQYQDRGDHCKPGFAKRYKRLCRGGGHPPPGSRSERFRNRDG